jgi:hypothetical protein
MDYLLSLNLLELVTVIAFYIINFLFFFGIFGVLAYLITTPLFKTPERQGVWFFIRYLIYVIIFAVYDLFVLMILGILIFNPIAPILIYLASRNFIDYFLFNTPVIKDLVNAYLNLPQNQLISLILFINSVLFGWLLIPVLPLKPENPFDYANTKKATFIARIIDRLLNFILRIRPNLDLSNYQIHTNISLENHLRFDNYIKDKLKAYEDWRHQKNIEMMLRPMRKRFIIEFIIFCLLVSSGVYGFWLYNNGTRVSNDLDDFLILLYFWGMIFLAIFFFKKRVLLKRAKKFKIGIEKLSKKFLNEVQQKYKVEIINNILKKEGVYSTTGDSLDIIKDGFLKLPSNTNNIRYSFSISDFIQKKINHLDIKFYDLFVIQGYDNREVTVRNRGMYIKTTFQENFDGEVFITTKNKSFFTRGLINYEFDSKGVKFETESTDFNRQFIVYTTNQIQARLALKTNIMYGLLQLANLNKNIYLKLNKNHAYLYFDSNQNFFEYDYFSKSKLDVETVFENIKLDIYNQYQIPILISLILNPRKKHN